MRSQAAVARHIGVTAPELSDVMRGRLSRFSQERLESYLITLGMDIRIVVTPAAPMSNMDEHQHRVSPGTNRAHAPRRGRLRVEVAESLGV
jgi:hypothetical protein